MKVIYLGEDNIINGFVERFIELKRLFIDQYGKIINREKFAGLYVFERG